MLTLICQLGVNSGLKYEFQEMPLLIGRKDGSHLQIKSPYVSKKHAEIILDHNQQYWIKDLGSMNGTSVDNQPVSALTPLKDGVTITFGKNEIYKVFLTPEITIENQQNGKQIAEPQPAEPPLKPDIEKSPVPEFRSASLSYSPVAEPAKSPVKRTTQPIAPSVPEEADLFVPQQSESLEKQDLDDSIFGLIDISTELKGHIQFQDQGQFEINDAMNYTEIYDAPEVLWPDIVQLKMNMEINQKVFRAAKILLTAQDEYHIFDQLREIFPPILPFQNGLVVYHKNILTTEEWQKHFLGTPDFELYEATILAHQEHHVRPETQILPHQKLKTGMLYHPLLDEGKVFGYVNIVCAFEEGGFVERDRLVFDLICQLAEIALAKFLLL